MRNLLILLISFLPVVSFARPKAVMSQQLGEFWIDKVMVLSNGNTFAYNIYGETIAVFMFDKDRKPITNGRDIKPKTIKKALKDNAIVRGFYEIGGNPVIFAYIIIDKTPMLTRMVFNAQTGDLESEEVIATLNKYNMGSSFAVSFGHADQPNFFIEKDPSSDNYAVLLFNAFARADEVRVTAELYNGEHKKLKTVRYDSPENQFKYIQYVAAAVDNQDMYVCSYGFNTTAYGGKDSRLIVSHLDKAANAFTHKLLSFSDDFKETRAVLKLNKEAGLLELLAITLTSSKENVLSRETKKFYAMLLTHFDASSLTMITNRHLGIAELQRAVRSEGIASSFDGLPQDIRLNANNTSTILLEEYHDDPKNIGVLDVDIKGEEVYGTVIAKNQSWPGYVEPFSMNARNKGMDNAFEEPVYAYLTPPNSYMSFDYVQAGDKRHFLYNEYESNTAKKTKLSLVDDLTKAKLMVKTVTPAGVENHFLFSDPEGKGGAVGGVINASHYSPAAKTYALPLYRFKGKKRQAYMGWVTFED